MKTAKFYAFDHTPTPDTCWSLSTGPDGRIYAASCCEGIPGGTAKIVRYDDATDSLQTLLDVAEATGQPADSGRATQCKIHYSFAPSASDGILYAATHLSAPGMGRKRYCPWGEWKDPETSFPQSMLLAYDTRGDRLAWTAPFIPREGCRCLAIDERRRRLYAISYPRDHFWVYDIDRRTIRSLGRLGTVNSQGIFTDRLGRVYTTNCSGQIVRYDPDSDELAELPVWLPHHGSQTGWHDVIYDVVASPEGDCVYGVPWNVDPHLFRYWPEEGQFGRMEDLGPVHQQDRDRTMPVSFYRDHCGGLVFGADGMLYLVTSRWPSDDEGRARPAKQRKDAEPSLLPETLGWTPPQGIVVQVNPRTLERRDFAVLERPGGDGHYVSRAGRDGCGNLFFGHVPHPRPAGISRLEMGAAGTDLHLPLRTWG